MRRTYTQPSKRDRQAECSAHIAYLWRWANAPEQETDSVAVAVRALLAECQRLADLVPLAEGLKAEVATLRGHTKAFHRELSRTRRPNGPGGDST